MAGASIWIFGMPFALALSCGERLSETQYRKRTRMGTNFQSTGFVLAAVSPAVVVVGMFNLQQRGYGVEKGIPSLVVAAASFDDVVAISGFSMCIGLL